MKRLLSVLLVLVLSLQVAVAGIHGIGEASAHLEVETLAHEVGADTVADADTSTPCCPWAHGCHGVHNLLPTYGTAMVTSPVREVFLRSADSAPFNWVPTPFDRPKWPAA
ncbi:hypothetical protein ACO2Q9_09835 [Variovorax sp. VNK109]|uniref:hypothetical protein n=1 Tax=Variovorax sp. VNK109 TaxID=3400919 RepID=UPI003C073B08